MGSLGSGSDGGSESASLGKLKPGEKLGRLGTVKPHSFVTGGPGVAKLEVVLVVGGGLSGGGAAPMSGAYHGIRESMNPKAYYWLDLETTGLDPHDDSILEIAVARAPFDRPFDLTPLVNVALRHEDWSNVDDYVKEMHFKSGLMLDCMKAKMHIDVESIDSGHVLMDDKDLLSLLHHRIVEAFPHDWEPDDDPNRKMRSDELPVLTGSSIHFDRGFLKVNLPYFSKMFSHRHYDVSSLKLVCRSLGMPIQLKNEAHRAFDDIKESVDHAQQCLWWLAKHNLADKLRAMGSSEKAITPAPDGSAA